jgi:hypothetical protein
MTERYVRLAPDNLSAAVAMLDRSESSHTEDEVAAVARIH